MADDGLDEDFLGLVGGPLFPLTEEVAMLVRTAAAKIVPEFAHELMEARTEVFKRLIIQTVTDMLLAKELRRRETFLRALFQQMLERVRVAKAMGRPEKPMLRLVVHGGHKIEGDLFFVNDRICTLDVYGERKKFVSLESILQVSINLDTARALDIWQETETALNQRKRLLPEGLSPSAVALQGILQGTFDCDSAQKKNTLLALEFEGGTAQSGKLIAVNSYGCLLAKEESEFGGALAADERVLAVGGIPDYVHFVPHEALKGIDMDSDRAREVLEYDQSRRKK